MNLYSQLFYQLKDIFALFENAKNETNTLYKFKKFYIKNLY